MAWWRKDRRQLAAPIRGRLALLWLILIWLGLAGCGPGLGGGEPSPGFGSGSAPAAGPRPLVKVFNFKVEMAEQLDKLVQEYERETGVAIEISTCGGGCDYSAGLKTKFNSGDKPDIFFVAGYTDLELWQEYLEDLSDQPWIDDMDDLARPGITKDGKVYGMPLVLEGWGFIYNKALFRQAGVTELPTTLSQLRKNAQQLEAAGIRPFDNGYAEWWVIGNHLVNTAFALQPDPDGFVAAVEAGRAKLTDNDVLRQWTDLVDLTVEYGQPDPLSTDYHEQVQSFAAGEAAMMQQGIWTQLQLDKLNPDLEIGFLPMPINDDAAAMDKLQIGVPNYWVVNNRSSVKREAKAFLSWLAGTASGQRLFHDAKLIPPFKSIRFEQGELGPLADDIMRYLQADRTLPWMWQRYPGYEANTSQMAVQVQAYIGKQIDRQRMLEEFQRIWDEFSGR